MLRRDSPTPREHMSERLWMRNRMTLLYSVCHHHEFVKTSHRGSHETCSPQVLTEPRMNGLSIRKLFLIVICLLAASVLIDFAHMVLSMIIDSVLAVAIVYFLWRIKGQYEERIKELEAEVRLLMSRRSGG